MKNLFQCLFTSLSFLTFVSGISSEPFQATIPVLDLKEFQESSTRASFVEKLMKAAHEVGFFALINPEIEVEVLRAAYRASQKFFSSSWEEKSEIYAPHLNGQRGFVPGETAQGHIIKDAKEFLHIGKKDNLWPSFMDLQTPFESLITSLEPASIEIQKALAIALGEKEDFFTQMTENGASLLRPIYYPANPEEGSPWAGAHTDINLFTLLPMSTEEGLEIYHQGEWIGVKVPENALIINCGDKLQNLSNGYFKSSLHRVVAKPNRERYSIVYFIHPRDEDSMGPTQNACTLTGGIKQFPEATSLELLAVRLRELGLASPEMLEFERQSGIMQKIEELIELKQAAEPVKKTYNLWKNLD